MVKKRSVRYEMDMTRGPIVRQLLIYMAPLLLGNLFQQMYNTVDMWVLGNYATNEAFSAVGAVAPVVNMLIGSFLGFTSGAGVVISQYYGASQQDNVSRTVRTSLVMTAAMSVIVTAAGILLTPSMLSFMKIPAEVYLDAKYYLVIYFGGSVGLCFYNIGSSIMQAIGDSGRPFIFLVICTVLNAVLDVVFVAVFHMGVRGVAYATILAQAISAVLTILSLVASRERIRISFSGQWFSPEILLQILRIGLPAALQMGITSLSNVFVQAYINYFGPDAMSGWTMFNKLDAFVMLPIMSMGLTITTFVGQNIGKGQPVRAKQGTIRAFLISLGMTIVLGGAVIGFSGPLIHFFNPKPEVMAIGKQLLVWITPFYFLPCINYVFSGALRGAGHSTSPMVVTILAFVVFRQLYMYFVSRYIANTILSMGFGYPAGWFLCSVFVLILFFKTDLASKAVTDTSGAD